HPSGTAAGRIPAGDAAAGRRGRPHRRDAALGRAGDRGRGAGQPHLLHRAVGAAGRAGPPAARAGRPRRPPPPLPPRRLRPGRARFYDAAVFTEAREVAFTGRIAGYEAARIGEYDYRMPRIDADVVYLWPERSDTQVIMHHPHPYYWHPYGWWWW